MKDKEIWYGNPSELDGKPGEGNLTKIERLAASYGMAWNDEQAARYEVIRNRTQSVAEFITFKCPPGEDKSMALAKLQEACNWAFKAIATE